MKKALVLGGNGFIGQHLVKELSKDYSVIVADIVCDVLPAENISYVNFDFTKNVDFAPLLNGVDMVFHLISSIIPEDGTDNLEQEISDNMFSTIKLLDAMLAFSVRKIYFVSSGGTVYGNSTNKIQNELDRTLPICKYGFVKEATEKIFELYYIMNGMQYRIIRLANPYGTKVRQGQRQGLLPILADCIWNNKAFHIWGDGENIRDYIHISDVTDAMRSIWEYDGPVRNFNVGSGRGYSINEVINIMINSFQKKYDEVIYKSPRLCDVKRNVLDISCLTESTGWKPKIQLDDGVRMLTEQYMPRSIACEGQI